MSFANTKLELESPASGLLGSSESSEAYSDEEHKALQRLTSAQLFSEPVIAIDLDDVLSQSNQAVADWHNSKYGTQMKLSDFYYYYYWKNPFWGTPAETFDKVKAFYSTNIIFNTEPVPGAQKGVQALKNLGYKLVIVTARTKDHADESWLWVERHFPGLFDSVICTGQFEDTHKAGHEVVTRLSKAQVCNDLNAKLLIDDSAENALQCATASSPTPVLLFGDYQWNQRLSGSSDITDDLSFAQRFEASGHQEFWKVEGFEIPDNISLSRVKDWNEVVCWVTNARTNGKM